MEKMENKGTFPTFPRHYGDYLYEQLHDICCTWNLNLPSFTSFRMTTWEGRMHGADVKRSC